MRSFFGPNSECGPTAPCAWCSCSETFRNTAFLSVARAKLCHVPRNWGPLGLPKIICSWELPWQAAWPGFKFAHNRSINCVTRTKLKLQIWIFPLQTWIPKAVIFKLCAGRRKWSAFRQVQSHAMQGTTATEANPYPVFAMPGDSSLDFPLHWWEVSTEPITASASFLGSPAASVATRPKWRYLYFKL